MCSFALASIIRTDVGLSRGSLVWSVGWSKPQKADRTHIRVFGGGEEGMCDAGYRIRICAQLVMEL